MKPRVRTVLFLTATLTAFTLAISASGKETSQADPLEKLAKLYDYSGVRGLRFKTTEGMANFSRGKKLRLDFASHYEMFPEDTAKYSIQDDFFTRKIFKTAPMDTGKIPGVLDFKSLILMPGNCEITDDSSHPDRKNIRLNNLLPGWFVLGFMPVTPIQAVAAQGWLDSKSLEIRHLEVEVRSPGGAQDRETYFLDFDEYFTAQGRLVPGRIRYSMPKMSAVLKDSTRAYIAQSSSKNPDRKKHILDLYQAELAKGNQVEADKIKRAATRIETLKRRIAESLVSGSNYYEAVIENPDRGHHVK